MTDKLEQAKADYIEKLKKVKLLEAGIDITDVDTYVKYITADAEEEIDKQAAEIVADIEQHNNDSVSDVYIDDRSQRKWRPF